MFVFAHVCAGSSNSPQELCWWRFYATKANSLFCFLTLNITCKKGSWCGGKFVTGALLVEVLCSEWRKMEVGCACRHGLECHSHEACFPLGAPPDVGLRPVFRSVADVSERRQTWVLLRL